MFSVLRLEPQVCHVSISKEKKKKIKISHAHWNRCEDVTQKSEESAGWYMTSLYCYALQDVLLVSQLASGMNLCWICVVVRWKASQWGWLSRLKRCLLPIRIKGENVCQRKIGWLHILENVLPVVLYSRWRANRAETNTTGWLFLQCLNSDAYKHHLTITEK